MRTICIVCGFLFVVVRAANNNVGSLDNLEGVFNVLTTANDINTIVTELTKYELKLDDKVRNFPDQYERSG